MKIQMFVKINRIRSLSWWKRLKELSKLELKRIINDDSERESFDDISG
jgi:hypothetical protein